jgi:hypothetical protein
MCAAAHEKVFFVYADDDTGKLYFYDTETQTTTYNKPKKALLINPETSAPYQFPQTAVDPCESCSPKVSDEPPPALSSRRSLSHPPAFDPQSDISLSVPPTHRRRKRRMQPGDADDPSPPTNALTRRDRSSTVRQARSRRSPLLAPTKAPPVATAAPAAPRLLSYAEEFFQLRVRPDWETRLPPGQVFQATPITLPLLPTMGKSMAKNALEAFRLILAYSGADGLKKPAAPAARALLQLCIAIPTICDEVYFQLVKQVRQNKSDECRRRTWELFLIVATAIPLNSQSEVEIKCHLAKFSRSKKSAVATLAEFTFIRFSARCSIGAPLDPITPALIASIPKDAFVSRVAFGASIYEQLYTQRPIYPRLPIPYIVYLFTRLILEKGGMQSEGLFRLAGKSDVVWDMIAAVNRGSDLLVAFAPGSVKDIAQVFKLWFANLPERIVPTSLTGKLRTVFETTKDYEGFLTELPSAHVHTLRFLCGFLKEVATAEAVTKMGRRNLVTVFSVNLVALPKGVDASEIAGHTACAHEFLSRLLERWDTSSFYPIPDEFL